MLFRSVRVDCVNGVTPETIRDQMQVRLSELVYGLIGGLENADTKMSTDTNVHGSAIHTTGGSVSKEQHVHVALVFLRPVCRATALKMCRESKVGDEYATLPMDSYDEQTCWKVAKILKKFGTPDIKLRFSSYYDALDQFKADKAAKALPDPVVPDYLVAMLPKNE